MAVRYASAYTLFCSLVANDRLRGPKTIPPKHLETTIALGKYLPCDQGQHESLREPYQYPFVAEFYEYSHEPHLEFLYVRPFLVQHLLRKLQLYEEYPFGVESGETSKDRDIIEQVALMGNRGA